MVIANDHYQSIGVVCLWVIGGVQRVARKRSISFNFLYYPTSLMNKDEYIKIAFIHFHQEYGRLKILAPFCILYSRYRLIRRVWKSVALSQLQTVVYFNASPTQWLLLWDEGWDIVIWCRIVCTSSMDGCYLCPAVGREAVDKVIRTALESNQVFSGLSHARRRLSPRHSPIRPCLQRRHRPTPYNIKFTDKVLIYRRLMWLMMQWLQETYVSKSIVVSWPLCRSRSKRSRVQSASR